MHPASSYRFGDIGRSTPCNWLKTTIRTIALTLLLTTAQGRAHAEGLHLGFSTKETPAEARRREEEGARLEAQRSQEKAKIEADRKALGLAGHRNEEADKFLKMQREAEAARKGSAVLPTQSSGAKPVDSDRKCETVQLKGHQWGRGTTEGEATLAMQNARSNCSVSKGFSPLQASCRLTDDGARTRIDSKGKTTKVFVAPTYECSRTVICNDTAKACKGPEGPPTGSIQ